MFDDPENVPESIIDERVVLFGMDDPGAAGAEPTMLVVSRTFAQVAQGRLHAGPGDGDGLRRGCGPRGGQGGCVTIRADVRDTP
jgi:hypothetical protein